MNIIKLKLAFLFLIATIHAGCTQNTDATNVADEFINSLSLSQKQKAVVEFNDPDRTRWHYFPSAMYEREGISLKELNSIQKELVHKLLQSYLSKEGYTKTTDVIEVEEILENLTGSTTTRDPELYYIAFYGKPSGEKPWGWSLEGHHLSLNFTIDGDNITYVPIFYGANPAVVNSGPHKGRRFLRDEEDIALKLINSFSGNQQLKAIFSTSALRDIVSGNESQIDPIKTEGIPMTEMDDEQQMILFDLIREYISSMPKELAEVRMQNIRSEEKQNIYFAWAGATKLKEPHYYRVQGKTFLIELDNTQNNANHIHSVWRDFDGDFGRNLIKEHYEGSHHH